MASESGDHSVTVPLHPALIRLAPSEFATRVGTGSEPSPITAGAGAGGGCDCPACAPGPRPSRPRLVGARSCTRSIVGPVPQRAGRSVAPAHHDGAPRTRSAPVTRCLPGRCSTARAPDRMAARVHPGARSPARSAARNATASTSHVRPRVPAEIPAPHRSETPDAARNPLLAFRADVLRDVARGPFANGTRAFLVYVDGTPWDCRTARSGRAAEARARRAWRIPACRADRVRAVWVPAAPLADLVQLLHRPPLRPVRPAARRSSA